jgi:phage gp36-like protein
MAYTSQANILGYVSQQDLINLTDDAPSTGNVNQTILNACIANISAEIDAMLGSIYQVPFSNPPEAVTGAATVMVCAALYRRRFTPEEKNMFAEDDKRYRAHFRAVGKGEEELDANTYRAFPPGIAQVAPSVFCGGPGFGGWGCPGYTPMQ